MSPISPASPQAPSLTLYLALAGLFIGAFLATNLIDLYGTPRGKLMPELWSRFLSLLGLQALLAVAYNYQDVLFRGVFGLVVTAAAAWFLYRLRERQRFFYALVELMVAAALGWHASNSLQLAGAVYVGIRGLDNVKSGWPKFSRSKIWLGKAGDD